MFFGGGMPGGGGFPGMGGMPGMGGARQQREPADTTALYEVLGVEKSASATVIKKAYRKMSLRWHPDRQASGTPEHKYRAHLMFQRISSAHDTLQEASQRPRYASYFSDAAKSSKSFFDPSAIACSHS